MSPGSAFATSGVEAPCTWAPWSAPINPGPVVAWSRRPRDLAGDGTTMVFVSARRIWRERPLHLDAVAAIAPATTRTGARHETHSPRRPPPACSPACSPPRPDAGADAEQLVRYGTGQPGARVESDLHRHARRAALPNTVRGSGLSSGRGVRPERHQQRHRRCSWRGERQMVSPDAAVVAAAYTAPSQQALLDPRMRHRPKRFASKGPRPNAVCEKRIRMASTGASSRARPGCAPTMVSAAATRLSSVARPSASGGRRRRRSAR